MGTGSGKVRGALGLCLDQETTCQATLALSGGLWRVIEEFNVGKSGVRFESELGGKGII